MRTFSEHDLEALASVGVTLDPAAGPDRVPEPNPRELRAGHLVDGTQVHVELVELGTGPEGDRKRQHWYEVIQCSASAPLEGLQPLLKSIDLKDRCAFVVPQSLSLTQHLTGMGGTSACVFVAIKELGLAIIALDSMGQVPTDLSLNDVCVTPQGTAHIRFATPMSASGGGLSQPKLEGTALETERHNPGPVVQLHALVEELIALRVVDPAGLSALLEIFEDLLAKQDGDQATGDLVFAVNQHQRDQRAAQAFDLVRRTQQEYQRVPSKSTRVKVAGGLGAVFLALCIGLIVFPKFGQGPTLLDVPLGQGIAATAGDQKGLQPLGDAASRNENLVQAAGDLVTARFDLIEQISSGATDIATVAQVVSVDSPAHTQLVGLIAGLKQTKTRVISPDVSIVTGQVVTDNQDWAVVRIKYQVHQTQEQEGTQYPGQVLVEEVDLELTAEQAGWRISAAEVVGH